MASDIDKETEEEYSLFIRSCILVTKIVWSAFFLFVGMLIIDLYKEVVISIIIAMTFIGFMVLTLDSCESDETDAGW